MFVEFLLEKGTATFTKKIIGEEFMGMLLPTIYPFKEHEEVLAVGDNYTLTARIRKYPTVEGALFFLFPMSIRGLKFNTNLSPKNPYFGKILVFLKESPALYQSNRIERLGDAFLSALGYSVEVRKGFYLVKKGRKTVSTVPVEEVEEYKRLAREIVEKALKENKEEEIERFKEIMASLPDEKVKVDIQQIEKEIKQLKPKEEIEEELMSKVSSGETPKVKRGIFKRFKK